MMLDALGKLMGDLETNTSLFEPNQLRERIEALDRFDIFNLDMPPRVTCIMAAAMFRHAGAIQAKLETANSEVYEAIRREVRSGRGAQALLQWAPAPCCGEDPPNVNAGEGYDHRDELIAGVFQFEELETETGPSTAEMVFYQPTPARHIFDLFHQANLTEDDVLIDLGSGLGHVPLLTCICTNARAIGVEFEPLYVGSAQRAADKLNLTRVSFIEQDARAVDLTEGTLFYLYTPFKGKMLRQVLDSLQREAAQRDIRVCTFGPCAMTVAGENWLEPIGPPRVDRISVFRSRE